jgi:diguanylate cyclase (GGDEF)-like protein
MAFPELSHDDLRRALGELDQALFNHEQWYEALNRTLICGLAVDQRDIDHDSFRKCRFGQWLYGSGEATLARHPGFVEIVAAHVRMHQAAKDLLLSSMRREPISIEDYERFANALKQMRLEIYTTRHELEDVLYNVDPLTGAASRIAMLTKLRERQAMVQREMHACCLAMMDVDSFKQVNDVYGHAAGDRVLASVAKQVKVHLRPYDLFFRYGGEEFLICGTNMDLQTGYVTMDRLREQIANLRFENGAGFVSVTASFGLTLLDPDVTVEQSIERADKALYAAKVAGRNRVVVWDPSMS